MNQSIYTEYSNLTPDKIQWLDGCGAVWKGAEKEKFSEHKVGFKYIIFNGVAGKVFSEISYEYPGYTHIPTGSEFCERVAEILGIEKPVFGDKFIKAFEPNEEEINKGIDKAEKEWQAKDKVGEDLEKFGIPIQPTHPHRVYRVLDSLDDIPFDTRIPLSEWIPPFDINVLFIMKDYYSMGRVREIKEGFICLGGDISERYKTLSKSLDGHWMRIV